jgi:hypothetical protein
LETPVTPEITTPVAVPVPLPAVSQPIPTIQIPDTIGKPIPALW